MNENKASRFVAPEVWWPDESATFAQSFQRNSVPSIQRAASPFFSQPQYNAARGNVSQERPLSIKPDLSKQGLPSSNNITASNPFEIHSATGPPNSGSHRLSLPYSNAPRITPMYNAQQVNPPNLYHNHLKHPGPSHFNFPSVYPSANQPPNASTNQPTSNATSNVLSNHNSAQISEVQFNTPHCNYNFNGYSPGEHMKMINHGSSVGTISMQSVSEKVPLQHPQTVRKDNSNNWHSYPGILPLRMPTDETFHAPQIASSCRPPFNFEVPQSQTSLPPPSMNSHHNSLPSVFPNNISQCSKPGTTECNPSIVVSKVEEVCKDKTYSCGLYSKQQNLIVNSNVLMVPPPSNPNHLYTQPPIPLIIQNASTIYVPNQSFTPSNFSSQKEDLLSTFLQKFHIKKKPVEKNNLTVVEFRSALKLGFSLLRILEICKCNFTKLLQSSEETWSSEMKRVSQMQEQLSEICSMISSPNNLLLIERKLKIIKKKREHKKRGKRSLLNTKLKALEERNIINQDIDKWLDFIKEKNLKLKREVEMKKEADNILSEVRRKIQEAKRTIEKIKVFEKLRSARQANAVKKSLYVLPEHNDNFEKKVSILKETMSKQLSDYEAEEKALKVMLETEQEGQLEEEALWRVKKIKTLQQKKQKNIYECLFGDSEEPSPTDPLYLFYKHHDSANNSIENLVQIRHHWDVHLVEDGESIPQQWVSPVPAGNPSWEVYKS